MTDDVMRRIIFHIPLHLDTSRASASQIRPIKMLESFRANGYAVDVVEGYALERKHQITCIMHNIQNGIKYDFLYSESSTMPTLLTEEHHLPTHPFLDFRLFSFCRRYGIPVGLFYRDIHWCYINKNRDVKQRVAKYFYRYDLWQYKRQIDALFVPSYEMFKHIPFKFERKVAELPAGCEDHRLSPHVFDGTLRILYIGGIGGNYDLRTLLLTVRSMPTVSLTICCRPDDWELVADDYAELLSSNISIVHKHGDELVELYATHDIFTMFFTNDYIRFAVPYKLFDTMGYGMPVLAPVDTWTGNFIRRQNAGIVCDFSVEALSSALISVLLDPECIAVYRRNMLSAIPHNTWGARTGYVAEILGNNDVNV